MAMLEKLSPRERQVMDLVMQGFSNKQIARIQGVSPKTVDTQRFRAMTKLGVHNLATLIGAVKDEQSEGWLGWKCPVCSTVNAPWAATCNTRHEVVLRAVV